MSSNLSRVFAPIELIVFLIPASVRTVFGMALLLLGFDNLARTATGDESKIQRVSAVRVGPFSTRRTAETQRSSLSQFAFRPAGAEAGRFSWKYSLPLW